MKKTLIAFAVLFLGCSTAVDKAELKQSKTKEILEEVKDKSEVRCFYREETNRGVCIFRILKEEDKNGLFDESLKQIYKFCNDGAFYASQLTEDEKVGPHHFFSCAEEKKVLSL